jgi:Flp pilus assembly protein TadG
MKIRARNHGKYRRQSGSTIVEFTLVGIPLIFVLISIFEISRGMWLYETAAHAVREGARYAAVHGNTCNPPNACAINIGTLNAAGGTSFLGIAQVIQNAGVGLDPDLLTVTISAGVGAAPLVIAGPSTLTALLANSVTFSNLSGSGPGEDVVIKGSYEFRSALAMFWPGGGHTSFAVVHLAATSRERIEF